MPFEPAQDPRLAVTSVQAATAGQLDINPPASRTWSSLGFAVVSTGTRNDADRTPSDDPDDALALFAPETSMGPAEETGTAAVDGVGEPAAPETAIMRKRLAETAVFEKRLEELEESAAKISGEYRECQKVEEVVRAAERRSAAAVETLEQIEKSLGELTLLHDLAQVKERLAALNERADELDERMARQARDRAETIDVLFRVLRAVLLGSAALLAAVVQLARRGTTFLAGQARRTYESISLRRTRLRAHLEAAGTNLQAGVAEGQKSRSSPSSTSKS